MPVVADHVDLRCSHLRRGGYWGSQEFTANRASGTPIDRDSLVEQATERRLWLQFAADAEWPHTDPANTPVRREFQLPATRAFIG